MDDLCDTAEQALADYVTDLVIMLDRLIRRDPENKHFPETRKTLVHLIKERTR